MSRKRAPVSAWWKAQELLARRAHGTRELIDKLRLRDFPEEEIDEAIARLQAKGLLDDREFALRLVEELFFRRGWGWYQILPRLRRKGLEAALGEEVCRDFFGRLDETELKAVLGRLIEKKRRRLDDRRKLYAWLRSRGFRREEIELALNETAEFPEAGPPDGAAATGLDDNLADQQPNFQE